MRYNQSGYGWRTKQTSYKKQLKAVQRKKTVRRTVILLPAFCIVVYAAISGIINLYDKIPAKISDTVAENPAGVLKPEVAALITGKPPEVPVTSKDTEPADVQDKTQPVTDSNIVKTAQASTTQAYTGAFPKKDMQKMLGQGCFSKIADSSFEVKRANTVWTVQTTVDKDLQSYINESVSSIKLLRQGRPKHFAAVVMDPETGKIVALGGYDDSDETSGICFGNLYPAASVFKIVTAAAALESKGFTPKTVMLFHGNKYTLYKSQINDRRDRYATKITFDDSFAQSVNPVFGKIGASYLDQNIMGSYGAAFGFNKKYDFEIPLESSVLATDGDKFHQAEIASGYNRETRISPVHGAMIVSAVVNGGRLPEPYLVEKISDSAGTIIYQASPKLGEQAISPDTASSLQTLMGATITRGTGKKSFTGSENDRVLKDLDMGGKTGSIDNSTHDVRYDWFVGFAKDGEKRKLAVSIVVGHEKFIGTKASRYARMIFKHYFQEGQASGKGV